MTTIKYRLMYNDALSPMKMHTYDAGLDLCAYTKNDISIMPHTWQSIHTGVQISIPINCVGLICPRSGLARDCGISIVNSPGIVDTGYHGEIIILLMNNGHEDFIVHNHNRIAQLVIVPILNIDLQRTVEWPQQKMSGNRGSNGFGSTGV